MKRPALTKPVRRGLWALPVLLMASAGTIVYTGAGQSGSSASRSTAHSHHVSTTTDGGLVPVVGTRDVQDDIAAARQATDRFHDIEVAKASGYPKDVTGCVESPTGGGMGYHYLNPALERDGGQVDVTKPEALLYEPQADGSLELVALEYIVPLADHPATEPPPTLYGRQFDLTPQATSWTLHAWVWRSNPDGMFTPFNPNVSCEHAG